MPSSMNSSVTAEAIRHDPDLDLVGFQVGVSVNENVVEHFVERDL